MLTPTSYSTPEDVTPGNGRGGGIGGGGEPLRYVHTAQAFCTISPWNDNESIYGIGQINLGNNFISNLEVVSALNTLNLSTNSLHYNHANCTSRFYPKVYLSTLQSVALQWNYDSQKYANKPIQKPSTWPEKGPQKGEELRIINV